MKLFKKQPIPVTTYKFVLTVFAKHPTTLLTTLLTLCSPLIKVNYSLKQGFADKISLNFDHLLVLLELLEKRRQQG